MRGARSGRQPLLVSVRVQVMVMAVPQRWGFDCCDVVGVSADEQTFC